MAQALLHDPQVLILDEPTSGLDPNQTHDVRLLIQSLSQTKTILLSTHILQEVKAVCSRVVLINESMARQYFPDVDPLGQRIQLGTEPSPTEPAVRRPEIGPSPDRFVQRQNGLQGCGFFDHQQERTIY